MRDVHATNSCKSCPARSQGIRASRQKATAQNESRRSLQQAEWLHKVHHGPARSMAHLNGAVLLLGAQYLQVYRPLLSYKCFCTAAKRDAPLKFGFDLWQKGPHESKSNSSQFVHCARHVTLPAHVSGAHRSQGIFFRFGETVHLGSLGQSTLCPSARSQNCGNTELGHHPPDSRPPFKLFGTSRVAKNPRIPQSPTTPTSSKATHQRWQLLPGAKAVRAQFQLSQPQGTEIEANSADVLI